MSHLALQRCLVRLMYDQDLVARVAAGEVDLTADGLSAVEAGWLQAVDRRAFGVDPYRRARSLQGLLDEYPTTAAWWYGQSQGASRLDAFFSSDLFHSGIMRGESLAACFGDYLVREGRTNPSKSLAQIEQALAVSRRGFVPAAPEGRWFLAPGLHVVRVRAGALASYSDIWKALQTRASQGGRSVVEVLLDPDGSLPSPEYEPGQEWILARDGTALESLAEGLGKLMLLAQSGATRGALLSQAASDGASAAEAEAILDDLVQAEELRVGDAAGEA